MAGKIFINYRRGDDPGFAQALFGRLEQVFTPEQLFMDIDSIEPGLDFVRVLEEQVAQCDVLISVIGRNWVEARDETGARRLDNPDDFVRIEIESALAQDKRVIPVLVGQAAMPRADDLPVSMKSFVRRHAVRLTLERFKADTEALIAALQRVLKNADETRARHAEREREEAEMKHRAEEEARQRTAEQGPRKREAEIEQRRNKEADARRRPEEVTRVETWFAESERLRREAETGEQQRQREAEAERSRIAALERALEEEVRNQSRGEGERKVAAQRDLAEAQPTLLPPLPLQPLQGWYKTWPAWLIGSGIGAIGAFVIILVILGILILIGGI